MLQKVTRLDSVPTAEETVLTTEVPTKESRLYTLLDRVDPDEMPHRMRHFIWILTACQRQCNTQKLKPSCENCDCCLPEFERISSDPNSLNSTLVCTHVQRNVQREIIMPYRS